MWIWNWILQIWTWSFIFRILHPPKTEWMLLLGGSRKFLKTCVVKDGLGVNEMGWLWKTCIVIWTCHYDGYRIQILEPTKHVSSLTLSRPRQASGVSRDPRLFVKHWEKIPSVYGGYLIFMGGKYQSWTGITFMIPAISGYHKTIWYKDLVFTFCFP